MTLLDENQLAQLPSVLAIGAVPHRTQVIALIDVRRSQGERVAASSYNVFVEC